MCDKYLILEFHNAKLFRKIGKTGVNYGVKDISINHNGYMRRDLLPSFIEPITVHQISNMIHVLFNERPVPSLRHSLYGKNEYLFEKARKSYLKITTYKDGNGKFVREKSSTKKAVYNSWNPSVQANWSILNRYIGDEVKFNVIVDELNTLLGINSQSIALIEVRNLINALSSNKRLQLYTKIKSLRSIDNLIYWFGRNNKTGFDNPVESALTSKNETAVMVTNGIDDVEMHCGNILVPVTDSDIEIIRTKSKGCATILDGGFVQIVGLVNADDLSVDGYTIVSDISDAKSIPAAKS